MLAYDSTEGVQEEIEGVPDEYRSKLIIAFGYCTKCAEMESVSKLRPTQRNHYGPFGPSYGPYGPYDS